MIIDNEFKSLIPVLTVDEFNQLEANILKEGIRDSLIVWGDILVDGHNRYTIADKHNIAYTTKEINFDNREDAKRWIILNQFGRRNINNYQRSVLALKLEDIYKAKAKENERRGGGSGSSGRQKSDNPIAAKKELAKTAKVSHDTISKKKKIQEKATEETKLKLETGEISINKAFSEIKKQERKEEIEKQKEEIRQGRIEMPIGTYEVIVIDPPWMYGRDYDPDGSRVSNPYPEMSQNDLKNLSIPSSPDCILWLWTTHKFIWDARELLSHWGFEYKAMLVWDKEKMGLGVNIRMQCEFFLVGFKGKPYWQGSSSRDIIREARTTHSTKPNSFYDLVNKLTIGRKLDYFARKKREGWDVYGDEV